MDAHVESLENKSDDQKAPLHLLSVVIPAHNEEGCIASTVEHLHLELRLQNVPHEIVVVDDGSTDATWQKLLGLREHISALKPVQNQGAHGFGRAVEKGFASMSGDAAVVMMADESDDCRDVVRYWELLNQGWDAVFGSRFVKGGGVIDYPWLKLLSKSLGKRLHHADVWHQTERYDERLQGLSRHGDPRLSSVAIAAF